MCKRISINVCSEIPASKNPHHTETSQLIYFVNQLTGFYTIRERYFQTDFRLLLNCNELFSNLILMRCIFPNKLPFQKQPSLVVLKNKHSPNHSPPQAFSENHVRISEYLFMKHFLVATSDTFVL